MRNFKWTLTYDGTETQVYPQGWEEFGREWSRSENYHGIFRYHAVPLKFPYKHNGGGNIILAAYDAEGIEAEITLKMSKYNGQTDDYDLSYTGILDMKPETLKFNEDAVDAASIDGSKENKLMSRDEINYNYFDRVSSDLIETFERVGENVTMKEIDIHRDVKLDFDSVSGFQSVGEGSTTINSSKRNTSIEVDETGNISTEDELLFYENQSDFEIEIDLTELAATFEFNYLATIGAGNQMTFDLTLAINLVVFDADDLQVSSTTIAQRFYDDIVLGEGSHDEELSGTLTETNPGNISVPIGGKVELRYSITTFINLISAGPTLDYTATLDVSNFEGVWISPSIGDSISTGVYTHELVSALIASMTSETDTSKLLRSEMLGRPESLHQTYTSSGFLSKIAVMNGFMIRKFPNPALNTNFDSVFKTLFAINPIGMGIDRENNRFYIEHLDNFYTGDFMFDLGTVDELEIMPLPDAYFSSLKAGYGNKVEYEEVNGAKEFNVPCEYGTTIPVKDDKDLQTVYYGDSIGPEIWRRKQYRNFASTDTKGDENNYFIYAPGNVTEQGYGNPSGLTGIEQYYNIRISPRENLLRHEKYLHIPLWKKTYSAGETRLKFINSQKNINFEYDSFSGNRVNQLDDLTADEIISGIPFRPELHKMKSYVNQDRIDILDNTPHGYVTYNFRGNTYQGHIFKVKTNEFTGEADFEILPRGTYTAQYLLYEDGNVIEDELGAGILSE